MVDSRLPPGPTELHAGGRQLPAGVELRRREVERLSEQLNGLSTWGQASTPLQIAQAAHTQPRLGCQFFLRQTSFQPMPSQQAAKALR